MRATNGPFFHVEARSARVKGPACGEVMIFKRSRNVATGDNSMYCMIQTLSPAQRLVKGGLRQTREEAGEGS